MTLNQKSSASSILSISVHSSRITHEIQNSHCAPIIVFPPQIGHLHFSLTDAHYKSDTLPMPFFFHSHKMSIIRLKSILRSTLMSCYVLFSTWNSPFFSFSQFLFQNSVTLPNLQSRLQSYLTTMTSPLWSLPSSLIFHSCRLTMSMGP